MDNITYDDEGNPVVTRRVVLAEKPDPFPRQKLTGIFEIDGKSFDVVLDGNKITFTPVNAYGKAPKLKKSRSFIKKLQGGKDTKSTLEEENCIYIKHIIGVEMKRVKQDNKKEGPGLCQGVAVTVFEKKDTVRLRDRLILLAHPTEDIVQEWIDSIKEKIQEYPRRPKHVKVYIQPYAGKSTKAIYQQKILPLFNAAEVEVNLCEFSEEIAVKDDMDKMDLELFDSVVCVGGDGTVNKVMNALINKTQTDEGFEVRPNFSPAKPRQALGIIPTGEHNQIAYSCMGTDDPVTAALHIILGNCMTINVMQVIDKDERSQWAFNSHYGFFGGLLHLISRYNMLGEKSFEAGILKALTKSKLRAYECDIQYVPGLNAGTPMNHANCQVGCPMCETGTLDSSRSSVFSDRIQELDPLAASSTSSTIIDLSRETPWKTLKGNFLNVSLFSIPGRCELAPLGMSKYTHLNDGMLDLVMVKDATRKNFVRYLRRHGNEKNQFDFPFIETIRCKSVRFSIRLNETWNHRDFNFSEIDYEVEKQEKKLHTKSKSMQVIDDLRESDDDLDDDGFDDDDETLRGSDSQAPSIKSTPSSAQTSRAPSRTNSIDRNAYVYRPTFQDVNRARRNKIARKKAELKRRKAEERMKSIWNIDTNFCTELDLEFRGHSNLLTVHAAGIPPDLEPDEVKMKCLSIF